MMKMRKLWSVLAIMMAVATVSFSLSSCGGDDDPISPVNPNPNNGGGTNTPMGNQTLILTRTCSTCEGSKNCTTCKGTGKGCKTCKGTGEYCIECGTTGECGYCYGSGVCQRCQGKKGEECSKCGYRHGKCWLCNGTKISYGITCKACGGSGVCDQCHGNWWQTCSSCYGDGYCYQCRGNKICQTCKGTPTCKTCGGDGHCQACTNSDGKCKDCAGTGEVSVQSLSFTDGGDNERIFIHSTGDWQVSSDVEWLTFSRSSGSGDYTLTVTVAKNNTASTRNGIITFTYGNSKQTVSVTQSGEPVRLSIEASSVFVYSNGTGESFTIKSNTSWTVKAADSWVTCSPSSGNGDATVTVSASAYSGTRYSTLTITDATGEVSFEVSVAQASSKDVTTALRNWLEKPMGVVNVNMKTESFQTIKNAVAQSYVIEGGTYDTGTTYFFVWRSENDACQDMAYQGLPFYYMHISQSKYNKTVSYNFSINVVKASYDYTSYLNSILQDFKYNMNVSLEKLDNNNVLAAYRGYDDDKNEYYLSVYEYNKSSDTNHTYEFEINAYYK